MNNTTTYSVNAANTANTQSEKSSKWAKVGKIATGIALAGALTMGVAKYAKNSSETNSNNNWEVKTEVVVTPDNQNSEQSDIDFDKAAAELDYEFEDMQIKADSIANLEEAKRIEAERKQLSADIDQLASENKQLAADIDKLVAEWKAIEKNNNKLLAENKQIWLKMKESLSTVTKEQVRSSEEMQDAIIKYVNRCKKNWYQPGQHVQSLMASIKK